MLNEYCALRLRPLRKNSTVTKTSILENPRSNITTNELYGYQERSYTIIDTANSRQTIATCVDKISSFTDVDTTYRRSPGTASGGDLGYVKAMTMMIIIFTKTSFVGYNVVIQFAKIEVVTRYLCGLYGTLSDNGDIWTINNLPPWYAYGIDCERAGMW